MTKKYSVRLRTLLPRVWARLGVAQSGSSVSPTGASRRRGPSFKWLRTAAHSQATLQRSHYMNAAKARNNQALTQKKRTNFNSGPTKSNPSAHSTPAQARNLTRQKPVQSQDQRDSQRRPWLAAFLISSGIGLGALIWLFSVPPSPNCQGVSPLATDSERLYCADQAAREGEPDQLVAALAIVKDWPQDHPLASQANQLADKWSRSILGIAQQKMDQGHLQEAVSIARQVPQTSSIYPEVQTTITAWESNWDQGQKIADSAQEALKQQEWRQALGQLQLLLKLNNEYWRQQADKLAQQIGAEQQAWQQLQQAQSLAQANTPEQLAQAIMLTTQLSPQSYAWDDAKAERERWSQALLEIAKVNLDEGDFQEVVAAAEKVPLDSAVHAEAQELTQFGQAQLFTQQDTLWGYIGAWTLTQQIEPSRPLHQAAQTNVAEWEKQIQNLAQFKLANWFASLDQIFTYQLAVEHAQMVEANQPRRLQAQTLIAHWRNQVEILEDRPYILWANQLAAQDTIQKLKQAIAEAKKIVLGRALRLEAQTLIAQWISRIQIIEDQPILNEARALADQGQPRRAIEVAGQISPGRALYDKAQGAISEWVGQIQIAEDRPILNEANALANQGDLTQAIAVASQINPGRALYPEAQGAISRWMTERDALQVPPQPEPTVPDGLEPSNEDEFGPPMEDDAVNGEEVPPPAPSTEIPVPPPVRDNSVDNEDDDEGSENNNDAPNSVRPEQSR